MATRNPVSVLPDPVGEATSTSRPVRDVRPRRGLRARGPGREAPGEPAGHGRVEQRLGPAGVRRNVGHAPYSTRML